MAPLTSASDIFSLGVVLCELRTGLRGCERNLSWFREGRDREAEAGGCFESAEWAGRAESIGGRAFLVFPGLAHWAKKMPPCRAGKAFASRIANVSQPLRPRVDEIGPPPKPSDAARRANSVERTPVAAQEIRGELDEIASRALRYRPQDRYASATGLAGDLNRYLADEAVNTMAVLSGAALGLSGVAAWAITKKAEAEEEVRQLIFRVRDLIEQAERRERVQRSGGEDAAADTRQNAEDRADDVREVSEVSQSLLTRSLAADTSPREDRLALARGKAGLVAAPPPSRLGEPPTICAGVNLVSNPD